MVISHSKKPAQILDKFTNTKISKTRNENSPPPFAIAFNDQYSLHLFRFTFSTLSYHYSLRNPCKFHQCTKGPVLLKSLHV